MNTLIVIPARMQSSRLPQKMLLAETGLPLIVHTCRAASASQRAESTIVAADDAAIFAAVTAAGFTAEMTAIDHVSGTDRVAEVGYWVAPAFWGTGYASRAVAAIAEEPLSAS